MANFLDLIMLPLLQFFFVLLFTFSFAILAPCRSWELQNRPDPCMFVCVSVCSGPVNNSSKMVKATDFKFDKHVSSDSPDMTP